MVAEEGTADAAALGRLLDGLTPRRVRQLADEGIVKKASRGRYHVLPSVVGYIRYLKNETRAGRGREDDDRFRRARAEMHEIDAAAKRGDLVPVAIMESEIVEVFVAFTRGLDAFGPRIAALFPKKAAAREQIDAEIRTLRDELARGLGKRCKNLEARAGRREKPVKKDAGRVGRRRKSAPTRKRRARKVSK